MKKIITLLLAAALSIVFLCGCESFGRDVNKASKHLTKYTIVAEYNETDHKVIAHQRVDFVNNSSGTLNNISLHLYGNAYREDAVYKPVKTSAIADAYPIGTSYGSISIANAKISGNDVTHEIGGVDKNILIIPLSKPLYPTEKVSFEFDFELILAAVNHRLGYSDKAVNLGNWYPVVCVYENGDFVADPYYSNGDPFYSDCANYDITFTSPDGYVVASSGMQNETLTQEGKTTTKMSAKTIRDFAVILSRGFTVAESEVGKTKIKYYYYDDADPQASLKASVDAVNTFNELFGLYPYGDLAVVQTTFLHGGMEYPNLVYISDALKGEKYLEVIIHEIAHQWWYGVVGNNEVAEAWLDEGLTEYSTTVFYEKNPSYGIDKTDRIVEALQSYTIYADIYKTITGKIDSSMNRPSHAYTTEYEYVYMTYVKGELMFDSLRSVTGDEGFFSGLRKYYSDNKFKNATATDLIGAFESESGKDLGGFFSAWLEGKIVLGEM